MFWGDLVAYKFVKTAGCCCLCLECVSALGFEQDVLRVKGLVSEPPASSEHIVLPFPR